MAIWSMDVAALNPSLHLEDILESIWNLVTTSDLSFQEVDMDVIRKYVAIIYPPEELAKHHLKSTIPTRQVVLDGRERIRHTLAYLESDVYSRTTAGTIEHDVPKWNWSKARVPSKIQKKKLIALALMAIMKTVLEKHLYEFDGVLYNQVEGGPIGENITQIAADLVMFKQITRYKKRLQKLYLVAS